MRFKHCVPYLSFVSVFPLSVFGVPENDQEVHNANHIFNAIHSSLRQWGSSLNHNGMSFFVATVPEGQKLYHGTHKAEVVTGIEWLAFEPEHALIFARPRRGPPGRPPKNGYGPPPPPPDDDGHHPPPGGERALAVGKDYSNTLMKHRPARPHLGHPLPPSPPEGHLRPPPPPPPPPPAGHPPPPPPPPEARPPPPPKDRHPAPHPPPPEGRFPPKDGHQRPPPEGEHPPHEQPNRPSTLGKPGQPGHEKPERFSPLEHHAPNAHQQPLGGQRPERHPHPHPESEPEAALDTGYLQTFTTKHPLRLLYLDGMSAGKTSNGTLDTQDILLLNLTSKDRYNIGLEHERAQGLCNFSSTIWEDKIDGILRMEGGFEIILCDFEKHLQLHEIMPVVCDEPDGISKHPGVMGGWRYIQAVTSRYGGLGGSRVKVNYDDFVSVFTYPGLDLFSNDGTSDYPMPRLQNVDNSSLLEIKDAVTAMILRSGQDDHKQSVGWQEIADLVVTRYSEPLHYLHSNAKVRESSEAFGSYLETLLRPFIDYTSRNQTLETERCVAQFVPTLPANPALAHNIIHTVTSKICDTLVSAFASSSQPEGLEFIDTLVSYLQWTTWKECGPCPDEKVCIIPIWPMGTHEDHANPKCLGQKDVTDRRNDYWMRW